MTQTSTVDATAQNETVRPHLVFPANLWTRRAKIQAAYEGQTMQEFAVSAIEFYVRHLEKARLAELLSCEEQSDE